MILQNITSTYQKGKDYSSLITVQEDESKFPILIEGVSPASFPFIISAIYNNAKGQYLIITDSTQKMQELALNLSVFVPDEEIFILPPWETLPYEFVSPPEKIERDRITALFKMFNGDEAVYITTIESLLRKVPEKNHIINKGMTLEIDDEFPFDDLVEMLVEYGYTRELKVEAFGQFSVKGGIIDVFLPSHENPIRLDFFGDTLESIREFNMESQISVSDHKSVIVYPRKELVLFKSEKEKLLQYLKPVLNDGFQLPDELQSQVDNNDLADIKGIEDLFPIIMNSESIVDYFKTEPRIIMIETIDLVSKKNYLDTMFNELYNKKKSHYLCIPPGKLFDVSLYEKVYNNSIMLQVFTSSPEGLQFDLKSIRNFKGKIKDVREEIADRISSNWKVVVTTSFEGQARRLFDLLSEFKPESDFLHYDSKKDVNIILSPLSQGFEIADSKVLIITDHEIFGKSYRRKKGFKKKKSRPIESFLDLNENDYVVHINHGIGIFKGIERMSAGGVERDFLMIEYADSDKLYVSLDQIIMVQKYIGMEGRKPKVDNLGKKSSWNRVKAKVQEEVEKTARELVKIYSKRSALQGFQFPPDTLWQEEFESQFEYEETPDQITAIEDVKDDMESLKPMDRLICGDVGFGKTEVAIRAAFKAVMAGRQVALLVPTTVLAMQHFSTFNKRFADYPVRVEMISRFKTRSQINAIKLELKDGNIDIIVGTHALLSNDVEIKNLGLLMIDEEQRFGVKHKEKIKSIKSLVDVMTLSATPIPRTMHMAMAGIRDLSIIMTPPENRQTIETYVLEENPDILREAILREKKRDGQVFFIHNRVQTIDAEMAALEKLVPEATFCVAHGQMGEHELEGIMIDFLKGHYDVLVSTTIIESGLDIPNVNTIIINRADTFGLSQLYQLKGRVGRSIRKAYAYLFYPKHVALSEEAQKRLQVISEFSELGSGIKVAMKDLEIRGAGNLLGKEQSGNIMEVGFELYTSMLEEAVKKLKGDEVTSFFRTSVFFNINFFIPDEYIFDKRQKIEFYKRFESCENMQEIDELETEMKDRFGNPPAEVFVLIEYEKTRTVASELQLHEILEESKAIKIKIGEQSKIDRGKLVSFLENDERLSLDPKEPGILLFKSSFKESNKKLFEMKEWLQQIS